MHTFEWNEIKNKINKLKHKVDFVEAQNAFLDKNKIYARDTSHSKSEERYFVFAKIKRGIITVRFTYRAGTIRIFGAGFWRKGKKEYEKQNNIHR
jgi:uncharacterized DUF497 family protein